MAYIGHNEQNYTPVSSLSIDEKKRVKKALMEMVDSLTRVDAETSLRKEILAMLKEELNIDPRLMRRMARTYINAKFDEERAFNEQFEESFETILNTVA